MKVLDARVHEAVAYFVGNVFLIIVSMKSKSLFSIVLYVVHHMVYLGSYIREISTTFSKLSSITVLKSEYTFSTRASYAQTLIFLQTATSLTEIDVTYEDRGRSRDIRCSRR
jgi:hypothetical protein